MKIETTAVTRVSRLKQCCQKEHCTYRANENMQLQKKKSLPSQWCTSHQQYHIQSQCHLRSAPAGRRFHNGMSEHGFKTRYNNHKLSFEHCKHSHHTVLTK